MKKALEKGFTSSILGPLESIGINPMKFLILGLLAGKTLKELFVEAKELVRRAIR